MEQRLESVIHQGRALVLADLAAAGVAGPEEVSLLEQAVSHRRWWADQWPQGVVYVPGLIAQDVQDAMAERHGRWPQCPLCVGGPDVEPHALQVEPELGEDPHWVCERTGRAVAPVGGLGRTGGDDRSTDDSGQPGDRPGGRPADEPGDRAGDQGE